MWKVYKPLKCLLSSEKIKFEKETKQECIPVGCALPTLPPYGGFCNRDPWTETPLDRDLPSWTETPHLWTESQTGVKHYLPATSFAGGNKLVGCIEWGMNEPTFPSDERNAAYNLRMCFLRDSPSSDAEKWKRRVTLRVVSHLKTSLHSLFYLVSQTTISIQFFNLKAPELPQEIRPEKGASQLEKLHKQRY